MSGKVMPYSREAEQSLLGCILLDQNIGAEILPAIKPGDFYNETHKYIVEAMQKIHTRGETVEFVTLTDELERSGLMEAVGGISYITSLTEILPSAAHYQQYLSIVKRDSVFRQLIYSAGQITEQAYTADDSADALDAAEKLIYDISERNGVSSLVPIESTLVEVLMRFDAIHKNKDAFKGLQTGFTRLDYLTNGLHGGNLIVIAARPGEGKTSLLMNIAENAALFSGAKVAVFSLEMSEIELAQRMLCSVASSEQLPVSMSDALKGKLTTEQWTELMKANNLISKAKIYFDSSSMIRPHEILSKCRRLKQKHGLDLIIIDYIQLMSSGNKRVENRQQEVSEITRNLKVIAKELNVPVIAASQLNRSSVKDGTPRRPQLSDLRESGAIEQDADIVMFIHHPDAAMKKTLKTSTAELILEKNRHGPSQETVFLTWKGESTRFYNQDKFAEALSREYFENERNKEAKKKKPEDGYESKKFEEAFAASPLPDTAPPEED